jgi:hypothetical protein
MKTYAARKNQTELIIDWRHHQENCWFDLHSKWTYLHHQHEMQQKWCIYTQENCVSLPGSMTHIMKQDCFVNWYLYEVHHRDSTIIQFSEEV